MKLYAFYEHTSGGDSLLPESEQGFFDGFMLRVEVEPGATLGDAEAAALDKLEATMKCQHPEFPRAAVEDLSPRLFWDSAGTDPLVGEEEEWDGLKPIHPHWVLWDRHPHNVTYTEPPRVAEGWDAAALCFEAAGMAPDADASEAPWNAEGPMSKRRAEQIVDEELAKDGAAR